MDALPLCTHCGFTWGEYRLRGLLGCPHCYAAFGEALQGDLLWIHEALAQDPAADAGAGPDAARPEGGERGSADPAADGPGGDASGGPALWRAQLAEAVRREDYAAAAALQRRIREAGGPPGGGAAGPAGTSR